MDKTLWFVFLMVMLFFCNGLFSAENTMAPAEKKILVVYFSHSGNTRIMAEMIREDSGAEIFEIVPVNTYPKEYRVVVEQAKKEINDGFKPEIKAGIDNISGYDVVFIGSPNWWSTIAPPVATFLSQHDLEGKKVVPFITHGGGGMGHSEADIRKLCPKATVLEGLAVPGNQVRNARKDISDWLKKIGILN